MDTTHQATTFTVEVRVDLLLKGGLVEVTTANGDTEGNGLLLGLTSDILENGDRGVDSTTLTEERADGTAGTLWCDKDDINVGWDLDLGEVLEDWGETVREVKGLVRLLDVDAQSSLMSSHLALDQLWLDGWPGLALGSIGEEVHDDGTLGDGLIDIEEVLAWDPAILLSILP